MCCAVDTCRHQQRLVCRSTPGVQAVPDRPCILLTEGIGLQGVACVVHYQLPASADMYVHRCGRTARAGKSGTAVALVTPNESARFAALTQVRVRKGVAGTASGVAGHGYRAARLCCYVSGPGWQACSCATADSARAFGAFQAILLQTKGCRHFLACDRSFCDQSSSSSMALQSLFMSNLRQC